MLGSHKSSNAATLLAFAAAAAASVLRPIRRSNRVATTAALKPSERVEHERAFEKYQKRYRSPAMEHGAGKRKSARRKFAAVPCIPEAKGHTGKWEAKFARREKHRVARRNAQV